MKVERGGFRGRLSAFLQKAMAGAAKKTPAGTDGRGASGVSRAQSGARAAPAPTPARAPARTPARLRAEKGYHRRKPETERNGYGKKDPMRKTRTPEIPAEHPRNPPRKEGLMPAVVDRNRWRSHFRRRPGLRTYRMHTSVFGGFAMHAPYRRPGPRAGAQPRFWRQLRQSSLPSTGCGGGASQGWTPASPLGGEDRRGPGRRYGRSLPMSPKSMPLALCPDWPRNMRPVHADHDET